MNNPKIFLAGLIVALAAIFVVGAANAQQKMYQLSPAASVSQTVGLTDITVTVPPARHKRENDLGRTSPLR